MEDTGGSGTRGGYTAGGVSRLVKAARRVWVKGKGEDFFVLRKSDETAKRQAGRKAKKRTKSASRNVSEEHRRGGDENAIQLGGPRMLYEVRYDEIHVTSFVTSLLKMLINQENKSFSLLYENVLINSYAAAAFFSGKQQAASPRHTERQNRRSL